MVYNIENHTNHKVDKGVRAINMKLVRRAAEETAPGGDPPAEEEKGEDPSTPEGACRHPANTPDVTGVEHYCPSDATIAWGHHTWTVEPRTYFQRHPRGNAPSTGSCRQFVTSVTITAAACFGFFDHRWSYRVVRVVVGQRVESCCTCLG
jgi:hypothetical protein